MQENSSAWLPWNDCHEIWDYNDIASSFSSYNPKLDDFFAKSAELVLAEGLRLYQDSKDIKKLINTIFMQIIKNLQGSLKIQQLLE
ncbi:type IV secretion-system coupling DNA-binding domain protein [Rickettsia hoogstraalii str. RCCE3]|nr:type IV secretion-system coupling DNA-binding domain protein [Rickettsia hoogstraalii str. RCCE3]